MKEFGTGSHHDNLESKIIFYPIDKYELKIELGANDEFISVLEIKVNKEFLSREQKIAQKGYHDVDDFYNEE